MDVFVPNAVIHDLYFGVFSDISREALGPRLAQTQNRHPSPERDLRVVSHELKHTYGIGRLKDLIAEDPRTHELDIQVEQSEGVILLRGEVSQKDRKEAVEQIARESFPGMPD